MDECDAREVAGCIARECIAVRLRLLNRVITGIYDAALRPHGLKVSQLNILVAVARKGRVRPADLCRALHMDLSTVSRNVDRLRARGWLESRPGEHGRSSVLRITETGARLLREAAPAWEQAQERAAETLGSEGTAALERIAGPMLRGTPGP